MLVVGTPVAFGAGDAAEIYGLSGPAAFVFGTKTRYSRLYPQLEIAVVR